MQISYNSAFIHDYVCVWSQWRKSACAECAGTRAPEPRGPPKKAAEPPRGLRLEPNRKFLRFRRFLRHFNGKYAEKSGKN